MALFAGVWHRAGGKLRAAIETDLLAALHAPFHNVLSAYDDGPFVLVARSLHEPAVVSHSGTVAALSGRLDGGLRTEHVLDAYMDPAGRFRSISGDYGVVVFDPHRHTLLLMRDAVGTQPIYYYAGDDGVFVFGSQIKAVIAGAALHARPNHTALAQLLIAREGVPRGQTCFAGVQSVPPGQVLFVTPDTISSTTHLDLRPIVPTPLNTFEQSTAAFRRAFTTSVERRVSQSGPTGVLVSGGVDSASVLAAARNAADAGNVVAISYGSSDGSAADERKYVDAVVQNCGVRCVRLDLQPTGFMDHVAANAWSAETPSVDDVPGTLMRAAAAAREHGVRDLMMGTWGDQVLFPFPPPYLGELLRAGNLSEYSRLTRMLREWLVDVPEPHIRSVLMRQAVRTFVPTPVLERMKPLRRNPTVFDGLRGFVKTRRRGALNHAGAIRREVTGPVAVNGMETTTKWGWANGLETHLPFLDADLVQLLFAVPQQHMLNDGVPKSLLRSAMEGLVPDEVRLRRDKGDYTDEIAREIRVGHKDCVESLRGCERLVAHGLMSHDAAARTLARFQQADEIETDMAFTLSSMLGVNAWLKVFFDGNTRSE